MKVALANLTCGNAGAWGSALVHRRPVQLAPQAAIAYMRHPWQSRAHAKSAPGTAPLCGGLVRRARLAGAPYQRAMVEAFAARQSTLLIAPTGGGKTLSGFLPSLIDIHETRAQGIHTLYVSPLKALTNDIERNLMRPIAEMGLAATVESRTGDTPQAKRARQRRAPPNVFLTTPESLMLMLSASDAPRLFAGLRAVIVDEVHSFAASKRGDFTALALSRLSALAPQALRTGLSATVADPAALAAWLGPTGAPANVLQSGLPPSPISACWCPMMRASPMAASWRATPCLRSMRRSAPPAPPSSS